MLCDPDLNKTRLDQRTRFILDLMNEGGKEPVRIARGVYQWPHFNAHNEIRGVIKNEYPEFNPNSILWKMRMRKRVSSANEPNEHSVRMAKEYADDLQKVGLTPLQLHRLYKRPFHREESEWEEGKTVRSFLEAYGVVDTPEQLLGIYDFERDPRRLLITLVEVRRDQCSPSGSWRYHKWGTYYGTQNPQHEYLYDDTHIERVFTFHIYELAAP